MTLRGLLFMSFGARLRRIRIEKGYSVEEMADLLGVYRSTVTAAENDINAPSFKLLCEIREKLNVPLDYYFIDDDKSFIKYALIDYLMILKEEDIELFIQDIMKLMRAEDDKLFSEKSEST